MVRSRCSTAANHPAHPIFRDFGFNASPRADYVGATYDPSGTFLAAVVKQLGAPDASGNVPTTGYVGRLAFPAAPSVPAAGAPKACRSRRSILIHLRGVQRSEVRRVTVVVNGRRQQVLRGRRSAVRVRLTGRPRQTVRVRLYVRTAGGRTVVDSRRYRTCRPRRPGP